MCGRVSSQNTRCGLLASQLYFQDHSEKNVWESVKPKYKMLITSEPIIFSRSFGMFNLCFIFVIFFSQSLFKIVGYDYSF